MAAVDGLRNVVEAHVQEEEQEILPALRAAAAPGQLDLLTARLEQNKQRVG